MRDESFENVGHGKSVKLVSHNIIQEAICLSVAIFLRSLD